MDTFLKRPLISVVRAAVEWEVRIIAFPLPIIRPSLTVIITFFFKNIFELASASSYLILTSDYFEGTMDLCIWTLFFQVFLHLRRKTKFCNAFWPSCSYSFKLAAFSSTSCGAEDMLSVILLRKLSISAPKLFSVTETGEFAWHLISRGSVSTEYQFIPWHVKHFSEMDRGRIKAKGKRERKHLL